MSPERSKIQAKFGSPFSALSPHLLCYFDLWVSPPSPNSKPMTLRNFQSKGKRQALVTYAYWNARQVVLFDASRRFHLD